MISVALALALFAQDAPSAAAETPAPAATEDRWPVGAPREPYPFVGWCYGALRGYLELRDEVMPEVTRIESTYRKPGTKLEDDLKVYADMEKDGRAKLKLFQGAMTAAEKASLQPINQAGANAIRQGRSIWNPGAAGVSKARKAQEWMSWALPVRCETVAANLEANAKLSGAAFRVNEPAPAQEPKPETPAN